jgi:quercetin dioxygenase-like cupin family protein
MTEVQDSGELKNTQVHNLAAAATQLLDRAAAAPAGRAALTLVPGAGAPLKQTLLAFRGGVQLAEHDAPGAATLQVLHGRVRLVTSQASWELGQSDHRTHQRLCVSSLKERGRSIGLE